MAMCIVKIGYWIAFPRSIHLGKWNESETQFYRRSYNIPIFAMTWITSYLSIIHFEKAEIGVIRIFSNISFHSYPTLTAVEPHLGHALSLCSLPHIIQ